MNQFSLAKLNISSLNNIQIAAAELINQKRDLILNAPTGSGKTLAFLLPLLERLDIKINKIQAIILVPSRELALQIEEVFKKLGSDFKISCCYGGHSVRIEENNFTVPPAVLIGTPGKIAFHLERKNFDPRAVTLLVLDEFDKSLEFGFEEDMAYIVSRLITLNQRLLTSATKMGKLPSFIKLTNPKTLDFSKVEDYVPQINFYALDANTLSKDELLLKLLAHKAEKPTLIFCNERETIFYLSDFLFDKNVEHEIFHGKMEQIEREKSLFKFKNGTVNVLVTTDLASRGLDIPEIENIIHYQMPHSKNIFEHRNGRTARMHADGNVFVFVTQSEEADFLPNDMKKFSLPKNLKPFEQTEWQTLYLSFGKKDKVNKVDIVGLFLQKGKLDKSDLGLIDVKDKASYLAIKKKKVEKTLALLSGEKIKGKKVKIEIAS
ncbi:superfamily II DNA/RNA helicase [Pedobacter sp. UYEF25]